MKCDRLIRDSRDAAGVHHCHGGVLGSNAILTADDGADVGDDPTGVEHDAIGLTIDHAAIRNGSRRTRREYPGPDRSAATDGSERQD